MAWNLKCSVEDESKTSQLMAVTLEQSCPLEMCPQHSAVVIMSSCSLSSLQGPLCHSGVSHLCAVFQQNIPNPQKAWIQVVPQDPWQKALGVSFWCTLVSLAWAHQHYTALRKWGSIWFGILYLFFKREIPKLSKALHYKLWHLIGI